MKNKPKRDKKKAFSNWKHNAVHLTFPNGNILSTVWGYCTYSDNYNLNIKVGNPIEKFERFMDSDTCEIMILKAPQKLVDKIHKKFDGDGGVIGYLSMANWLEVVKMLSK